MISGLAASIKHSNQARMHTLAVFNEHARKDARLSSSSEMSLLNTVVVSRWREPSGRSACVMMIRAWRCDRVSIEHELRLEAVSMTGHREGEWAVCGNEGQFSLGK
jgi:hypothetical protein